MEGEQVASGYTVSGTWELHYYEGEMEYSIDNGVTYNTIVSYSPSSGSFSIENATQIIFRVISADVSKITCSATSSTLGMNESASGRLASLTTANYTVSSNVSDVVLVIG